MDNLDNLQTKIIETLCQSLAELSLNFLFLLSSSDLLWSSEMTLLMTQKGEWMLLPQIVPSKPTNILVSVILLFL